MTGILEIPTIDVDPRATDQESTYLRLRHAIMTGFLAPETTLTIRGLAEAMEVSPTPIREAVRRLSTEYAIEVLGNRRMRIPPMSSARFEEVVNLRIAVEGHAATRALPYISSSLIREMTRVDRQMDRILGSPDRAGLMILNHEFHRLLYSANPHQAALPVVESIWLQLGPFQRQVLNEGLEFYQIDRHKEILGALRRRDAIALAVAIEADIRDGIYRSGRQYLEDRAARQIGLSA